MHTKEQIQLIAESLVPGFVPKDPAEDHLTFHFTLPPKESYKVQFTKDKKGEWRFVGFAEDERDLSWES